MYRRNGKPQSCEPCRKWKTRCDHTRPVCRRCLDRNIAGQCFYHPAPMSSSRSRTVGSPIASQEPVITPKTDVAFATRNAKLPSVTVHPVKVQSGVRVLRLLHQHAIFDVLIRESHHRCRVPLLPHKVLDSVLRCIRDLLKATPVGGLDEHLKELCARIFESSSHPLVSQPLTTVDEYISLFTGINLRWEAVGNIFAVAGRALTATPHTDALFPETSQPTRTALLSQMAEASDLCLSFCTKTSCSNELLVSLQVNDLMFKTQQYGDSSYQAWRRLGDVCATVYATGLHKQAPEGDPVFLAQWKRGCFAAAFYVDKCLATFLGRPPLLNYRYCSLVPPLDLSDEVLVAGGSSFDAAVERLGVEGWSSEGQIHRASLARIRLLLAVFRGQVLEIAANDYSDDALRRANQVLEEAQTTWERCPRRLRHDCLNTTQHEDHPNTDMFTIVLIHLDHLHSRFLLQQYMARHAVENHPAFLETARQILVAVVKATTYRASQMDLSRDYSWMTLYYGIPSATLLAQELHRTRRTPDTPPPTALPSTDIIRNLCVFLSVLSWVGKPGNGDYEICRDAERRLSLMVDDILDRVNAPQADALSLGEFDDPMFEWIDYGNLDFGTVLF